MTQFQRPPAVHFPLTQRKMPAVALGALLLAGLALLLAWRWQQDFSATSRQAIWWLAAVCLMLCAGLGLRWLNGLARGGLIWDGAQWLLRPWGETLALHALPGWRCQCTLDLQAAMLLRLEPANPLETKSATRQARWVWVARQADATRWQALRQAVVWSQKHGQAPVRESSKVPA